MNQSSRQSRRPEPSSLQTIKAGIGFFGRAVATVIMVATITGCIVACILTVYILKYIGREDEISLESIKMGYTSIVYAVDEETGSTTELQRLYFGGENRIWVDLDRISEYAKDAIVAIEDKRFYEHEGVDWKRTFGAFVNMFVPIYKSQAGGSTITQQLIKNITGDDDYRIERKVREIFRALNLSQRYSKDQVLEAYLNVVPLGNGTNGIQSAANLYFSKDAKDLTLAESAAIVGITQYPGWYDPFVHPENNRERQLWILEEMRTQDKITEEEYDKAVDEQLDWKRDEHLQAIREPTSYFVDHVIEEVIADLMEQKGYTRKAATDQLYQAGYRIYTTVDVKMQEYLEDIYKNTDMFPPVYNETYPQSCCVITDPHGKILAMVGGIGEKTGAREWSRVTMSRRQPGSSIKPLAAYALSFELNRITWSTMIEDRAILMEEPGKAPYYWPVNYYGRYDGMMTVDTAIQRSTNTVAAKLVMALTPQRVFNFLKNELNFHSLVEREVINGAVQSDILPSPMALGGMTHGVTPLEMAGGYQIYVNGGQFTTPYSYTEVLDASGRTILKKDTTPRRVLSEDTAVVVNKLLQRVVNGPRGTGIAANLGVMPTAGKTGTSQDDVDQWFIGITPYYVCTVWMGYDEPRVKQVNASTGQAQWVTNAIRYGSYPPPIMWKTIMLPLQEGLEYKNFIESPNVVSMQYCTATGDIATPYCPATAAGWYKKSRIPGNCTLHSAAPPAVPEPEDGGSSDSSSEPSIFDALRREREERESA